MLFGEKKLSENWDNAILSALKHPIRRQIIELLREKNTLLYNELLKLINISNHGKLGFHMRALKGLVEREPSTNKYHLTERGLLAGELAWDIRVILSRGSRDLACDPTRYAGNLKFGDHAFFLYDKEDDKRMITFSFLEAGLLRGEAVVFLVPERKLDLENREVQRHGVNADYFRKEAFMILSAEEWYLKKGKARANTIIANMLELLKTKQKAGFTGLRVTGEMEVFFNHAKTEHLLRYEAMLGKQFTHKLCGLCVYDAHTLDEKQISQLTNCHGHIISKDMAWKLP
jgi:DNA-binding transcriptional ArsR family regulator